MKLCSRSPGGVDLDRQPALREVDLDLVRALPQAGADLGLVLAQQVVDELLAGVAGDLVGRVHEAQGRGRDDRLLHRHVGVPQGHVQVAVRVPLVAERAGRQPRHPAGVAGRERDLEAVRGRVRQPVDAVRPEVVVLPLLAVGDDRRAGGLEPRDGVADRLVVERVQRRVGAVSRRDRLDQPGGRGMLPIGSVGIVIKARVPCNGRTPGPTGRGPPSAAAASTAKTRGTRPQGRLVSRSSPSPVRGRLPGGRVRARLRGGIALGPDPALLAPVDFPL